MLHQEEITIEDKLTALFKLQMNDTQIDKIKMLRGELPLEVKDLEDDIAGLETRTRKIEAEIKQRQNDVASKQNEIKEAESLIKKYTEQQNAVRNNREFESLAKEVEFQKLEIELCNKRIREYNYDAENKTRQIEALHKQIDDKKNHLSHKQAELDEITVETQKEEDDLKSRSLELEKIIDPRLLSAYKRIRGGARNGLSVVTVERDACGGCFNKIPPQRQLEIGTHKKVIVCEYCGRILVDQSIVNQVKMVD